MNVATLMAFGGCGGTRPRRSFAMMEKQEKFCLVDRARYGRTLQSTSHPQNSIIPHSYG